MSRWLAFVLLAALPLVPGIAQTQQTAKTYPTGQLTIGGEGFAPADVADARAMPDINKKVGILLTLTPAAAKRLAAISTALVGRALMVALDGKALAGELIHKPVADGVIELPGRWTLDEAETLARRMSGRDPLPDDL